MKANAEKAGVFGSVKATGARLECAAAGSAEPAWYRVEEAAGRWQVSLVTKDRWLSESIEADLMHHGDPIEELLEEELVDQGYNVAGGAKGQTGLKPVCRSGGVEVKHFRSEDMMYTFQSMLPVDESQDASTSIKVATQWLLAYEAAFRRLGDMEVKSENV
ncbi:MAG: hypothetical protein L0Y44_01615 [Phycisphaerales bacterium]|nr:hypothetical protein [Phycisphaerales bacterium]MCI0629335.1 hypothetical protein [Phycisphaerales bacterium]MCI0677271.1 hypothetical protein [Phycisphaerales bacterium]